jgi:hypothetical protein
MRAAKDTNRYLIGALASATMLPATFNGGEAQSESQNDGPRRPSVVRPQWGGTFSDAALDLDEKLSSLFAEWSDVQTAVLPFAENEDDDFELLVVDPDEIGFIPPKYTVKTQILIKGVYQGRPEALPLDDIGLEIFDL